MENFNYNRTPARPAPRPSGSFISTRQLRVPSRPPTAVDMALHHRFEPSPTVPPQYAHIQQPTSEPGARFGPRVPEPHYQPHSFDFSLPLPGRQPGTLRAPVRAFHHTFTFKAIAIVVGVGLAALGTYLGMKALSVPAPVSAETPVAKQVIPLTDN